jgi:anti-sigma factor RsiW
MKIERNVILDILPMYLANEVSPETRDLVEKYLETDRELARLAQKQKESLKFPAEIPVPLTEEDQIKAYKKSRLQLALTIVFLAALLAATLGITLMAFFRSA